MGTRVTTGSANTEVTGDLDESSLCGILGQKLR